LNAAFGAVKLLFDPDNRMNPGKIVATPKMDDTSLFRFRPQYGRVLIQPKLDWSAWNVERDPATGDESAPGTGSDVTQGFAKAVEMCNNNGHCRKFDAGVMCPSYRVTRDEQHTTRGRANTLRLALSGQLGDEDLGGEAVHAALDLCVSCKACRRECPTGVDMAKMKIESLAAYNQRHGVALRDRLIAHLPRYAPMVSRVAWLANLLTRLPGAAQLAESWLGLSARRRLPAWRGSFLRRTTSDGNGAHDADGREAVLFIDTFSNYFAHQGAADARRVLEAAGYTVHTNAVPGERPLCCGRTFLAAGMVDEAKAEARRTLAALVSYARRGVAIVGLEPSCLLGMRDEFLNYGLGEDAVLVARHAMLFEEFLVRERAAGRMTLPLKPLPQGEALLHGHCHQKAFAVMTPIQTALGWIPGLATTTIASGCCGMAGAFGYQAEHHQLSMQMAEQALLPAVRSASAATLIVADGFSCRHQIRDGAGRNALHVASVLAMALD
jgi:Fe-S oxidoreductase